MAGELNKLSDRKLKGLHGIPASKIEFYADGAGLSAKVTKAGGISWVFTYRLDGQKLHRLTLGRYPDMSLKELGEIMETPLGKSGVNHRLKKIEMIAEELKEKIEK